MLRLIWLLAIFLLGCDQTQESITPTQDDLDRIASILGQDRRPLLASSVTPARTSSLKLSDTRISFADALELGGCGLLPLIAERNSSLGRQKQESTRLIYEWKLKAGLNQCDELDDQEWFKKALDTKAKDVEIAVLQLLTQSEEATRIHLKIPKPFATLPKAGLLISTDHSPSFRSSFKHYRNPHRLGRRRLPNLNNLSTTGARRNIMGRYTKQS